MPPRTDSLHGFLCAEYHMDFQSVPGYFQSRRLAMFREPAGALLDDFDPLNVEIPNQQFDITGNIRVGDVTFGNVSLNVYQNGDRFNYFQYSSSTYIAIINPVWKIDGLKSIPGFSVKIPSGWPVVNDTLDFPKPSIDSAYTVDLSLFCTNFDSASVTIESQQNTQGRITHTAGPKHPIVTFSQEEMKAVARSAYLRVNVRASNFHFMKWKGRLYVFELIHRREEAKLVQL